MIDCVDHGYRRVVPLSRIDLLFEDLAAEIGVTAPRFRPQNVSADVASIADTTPEFRELFRRRADLDYFAYDHVTRKAGEATVGRRRTSA